MKHGQHSHCTSYLRQRCKAQAKHSNIPTVPTGQPADGVHPATVHPMMTAHLRDTGETMMLRCIQQVPRDRRMADSVPVFTRIEIRPSVPIVPRSLDSLPYLIDCRLTPWFHGRSTMPFHTFPTKPLLWHHDPPTSTCPFTLLRHL